MTQRNKFNNKFNLKLLSFPCSEYLNQTCLLCDTKLVLVVVISNLFTVCHQVDFGGRYFNLFTVCHQVCFGGRYFKLVYCLPPSWFWCLLFQTCLLCATKLVLVFVISNLFTVYHQVGFGVYFKLVYCVPPSWFWWSLFQTCLLCHQVGFGDHYFKLVYCVPPSWFRWSLFQTCLLCATKLVLVVVISNLFTVCHQVGFGGRYFKLVYCVPPSWFWWSLFLCFYPLKHATLSTHHSYLSCLFGKIS